MITLHDDADSVSRKVTVERLLELRSEVNGMAYFIQANSILDADSVNDAPSVDVGTVRALRGQFLSDFLARLDCRHLRFTSSWLLSFGRSAWSRCGR